MRSVLAASSQADVTWVLDNGDHTPFPDDEQHAYAKWLTIVIDRGGRPPNLSKIWNAGLIACAQDAKRMGCDKWDVAILNDDAIIPEGWYEAVSHKMREMRVAAACSGAVAMPVLHTHAGPVDLATRMQGYAFLLRGELGLRANEDLHWYFTDDYLDWESRKLGGMVMVPGFPVDHLFPNGQMTAELQAQCAIDAQTFVDLYGMRPW